MSTRSDYLKATLDAVAAALYGWSDDGTRRTYSPDELPAMARRLRVKAERYVAIRDGKDIDKPARPEAESLPERRCGYCEALVPHKNDHCNQCGSLYVRQASAPAGPQEPPRLQRRYHRPDRRGQGHDLEQAGGEPRSVSRLPNLARPGRLVPRARRLLDAHVSVPRRA